MSYSFSSFEKTTRTTTINGRPTTTTTTTTRNGDSSSVVVRELTESEVSQLSLSNSPSPYEISDDNLLTKYDFYSLMNTEDELDSETDSESDIEFHWFPSLLRRSVIQFLDDKEQEQYMDDDSLDNKMQVIEVNGSSEEEDEEEHRPKKADLVPVEVLHIVL
ncbi:unnamed protein product [Mucor hiemalis]